MEGLERSRPLCPSLPLPRVLPGPNMRAEQLSGTYHFLIAIGVHHPGLAVIAEAHEEGSHKVVTVEQTVKTKLLSPKALTLRDLLLG